MRPALKNINLQSSNETSSHEPRLRTRTFVSAGNIAVTAGTAVSDRRTTLRDIHDGGTFDTRSLAIGGVASVGYFDGIKSCEGDES